MKKVILFTAVIATLSFADGAKLYEPCAQCHGASGELVAMNASKIIKDMSKDDFIASMKGYKDGSYGGKMKMLMKGQVNHLSDADIQAIADYIVK